LIPIPTTPLTPTILTERGALSSKPTNEAL
jgi:hypothetical protein